MLSYSQKANASDSVVREVAEVLAEGNTRYQSYLFFKSPTHGTCIALDGDIQSVESDEGIYHEALVHPALLLHPNPKKVLIMGGGEGATSREVLRHTGLEKVVMVDIDEAFVDLCRQHIPDWAGGSFDDPRHEIRYEDIRAFVRQSEDKFDVVIGDLVDVSDADQIAAEFYSEGFYGQLANCLNDGAILATQGGPLSNQAMAHHNRIRAGLREAFGCAHSYGQIVPSFYGKWGYVLGGRALCDTTPVELEASMLSHAKARNLNLPSIGVEALARGMVLPTAITRHFV